MKTLSLLPSGSGIRLPNRSLVEEYLMDFLGVLWCSIQQEVWWTKSPLLWQSGSVLYGAEICNVFQYWETHSRPSESDSFLRVILKCLCICIRGFFLWLLPRLQTDTSPDAPAQSNTFRCPLIQFIIIAPLPFLFLSFTRFLSHLICAQSMKWHLTRLVPEVNTKPNDLEKNWQYNSSQ